MENSYVKDYHDYLCQKLDKIKKLIDETYLPEMDGEYFSKNAAKSFCRLLRTTTDLNIELRQGNFFRFLPDFERFKDELYETCAQAMGVTVEITPEGWLRATTPELLLRNIYKGTQWFIRDILDFKARQLVSLNYKVNGGYFGIDYGVVIFRHFFERGIKAKRDADNYEANGIVDALAMYFLPDDDYKHLHHYHISVPADKAYTEVFIVPQTQFLYWLSKNGYQNEAPDITSGFVFDENLYNDLLEKENKEKEERESKYIEVPRPAGKIKLYEGKPPINRNEVKKPNEKLVIEPINNW
jgi:hypothetical protein